VADLSAVSVMANVFQTDLPFVEVGDPASITTGRGRRGPARDGAVRRRWSTRRRARWRSGWRRRTHPGPLRKDLYVPATIQSRRGGAGLLVPASAVLRDDETCPSSSSRGDRPSTGGASALGTRAGDGEEVVSSLAAGEEIVVEGGLFMQFAESQ